jgi:hypothetical protein
MDRPWRKNIMPSSTLAQPALEMSANLSRLFNDINELHRATMQVVTVRMTRMAMAGPTPDARDRHEFSLMSREKSEVASESIQAMVSGFVNLAMVLASDASQRLWATSAAVTTLMSSRSATQWFERHGALLKIATESPANPLPLADSATCLMQDILEPIHGRATANAKRLSAL